MVRRYVRELAFLFTFVIGCTGVVEVPESSSNNPASDGSGSGSSNGPVDQFPSEDFNTGLVTLPEELFICDESAQLESVPLRRLSKSQYVNSINDLLALSGLDDEQLSQVRDSLSASLDAYPDDQTVAPITEIHGGFHRMDQSVKQQHVNAAYEVAVEIGNQLTRPVERLNAVFGECANNDIPDDDAECLNTFLERFGARILKRTIPDDEKTWFAQEVAGDNIVSPDSLKDVVTVLFTSPDLLYHVDYGPENESQPSGDLSAFSLAHRLSYHFWQTIPDDQLWELAASGALLEDSQFDRQVDRLAGDPRTESTVVEFFSEWFRLDELPPLNSLVGTPAFDAFAGANIPSEELHNQMNNEIVELILYLFRNDGTLADIFTSRLNVTKDPELAAIYGEDPWDGTSIPTTFKDPIRGGLLARGAFLASASGTTRPIIKGYRSQNGLLCTFIGPAVVDNDVGAAEITDDMTTREVVEALTEIEPCSTCHTQTINPMGFITENFDALGRVRAEQPVFGDDGLLKLSLPVDNAANPSVYGVEQDIDDPNLLAKVMVEGGGVQACFAKKYFRFSFARTEDVALDGCVLRSLQEAALNNVPLRSIFATIARQPVFRRRNFQ